jgi:hypothetical protein
MGAAPTYRPIALQCGDGDTDLARWEVPRERWRNGMALVIQHRGTGMRQILL